MRVTRTKRTMQQTQRRPVLLTAAAVLVAAAAAACGGGGGSHSAVPGGTAPGTSSAGRATMTVSIPGGGKTVSSVKRHIKYVAAATDLMGVDVYNLDAGGSNTETFDLSAASPLCVANVTGGGRLCTVQITAPLAHDKFAVTLYTTIAGTEVALAEGVAVPSAPLVEGQAASIPIALGGVVNHVKLLTGSQLGTPVQTTFANESSGTAVTLLAYDAANELIVGDYDQTSNTITVGQPDYGTIAISSSNPLHAQNPDVVYSSADTITFQAESTGTGDILSVTLSGPPSSQAFTYFTPANMPTDAPFAAPAYAVTTGTMSNDAGFESLTYPSNNKIYTFDVSGATPAPIEQCASYVDAVNTSTLLPITPQSAVLLQQGNSNARYAIANNTLYQMLPDSASPAPGASPPICAAKVVANAPSDMGAIRNLRQNTSGTPALLVMNSDNYPVIAVANPGGTPVWEEIAYPVPPMQSHPDSLISDQGTAFAYFGDSLAGIVGTVDLHAYTVHEMQQSQPAPIAGLAVDTVGDLAFTAGTSVREYNPGVSTGTQRGVQTIGTTTAATVGGVINSTGSYEIGVEQYWAADADGNLSSYIFSQSNTNSAVFSPGATSITPITAAGMQPITLGQIEYFPPILIASSAGFTDYTQAAIYDAHGISAAGRRPLRHAASRSGVR